MSSVCRIVMNLIPICLGPTEDYFPIWMLSPQCRGTVLINTDSHVDKLKLMLQCNGVESRYRSGRFCQMPVCVYILISLFCFETYVSIFNKISSLNPQFLLPVNLPFIVATCVKCKCSCYSNDKRFLKTALYRTKEHTVINQ